MKPLRIAAAFIAGLLFAGGAAVGASATPQPQVVPTNPCNLNAGGGANCGSETGNGGRSPSAQFDPTNWGGTCSLLDRTVVPCDGGEERYWNYAYQCYMKDISDTIPRTDPIWVMKDAGLVVECRDFNQTEIETFWIFDRIGTISPAALAQQLIASLELPPPGVTMTPDPYQTSQAHSATIGLPIWMWVLDPSTIETRADAEMAGTLEVSIEAVPTHIEWTMGDGTVIECPIDAPGWDPALGVAESPSCGHTYQQTSAGQPDERYEVVARAYYTVTWTAGSMSGEQEIAPFSTFQVPVTEMQVNVR